MHLFGRTIMLTTLDPIPRAFRAAPGVLAMNQIEIDSCQRNALDDAVIIKPIIEAVQAEDMADALRTFIHKPRKVTRKTPKIAPSHRMAMLNAINAGRRPHTGG